MRIPCLICKCNDTKCIESMTRQDLFVLWTELGRPVSEMDLIRCHVGDLIELLECHNCGFQFFDPLLAGDELFYRKLDIGDDVYYHKYRPEFSVASELAKRERYTSVFDIGCGSGSFLDHCKKLGILTYGLELNSAAADEALAKGHHIWKNLLTQEFINEHRGRYDLVTLLQVMEHVQDPVSMLSDASQLLSARGRVMIAVPNRTGTYLLYPLDPHQWPPHHVSRWRTRDFKMLAKQTGLTLEGITGDLTHGGDLTSRFASNETLARATGRPGSIIPFPLVQMASLVYRKLGLKFWVRNLGTSIQATYRRMEL